nr:hypothetical protein [Tanacetum cinerariifolium]
MRTGRRTSRAAWRAGIWSGARLLSFRILLSGLASGAHALDGIQHVSDVSIAGAGLRFGLHGVDDPLRQCVRPADAPAANY